MNSVEGVNQIFSLLYTYSYLILFPLVVVEGPIVTIISGFLISLGFMDFLPTYLTVVTGDIAGDILYYAAGKWWLNKTYRKFLRFFNIKPKFLAKIENLLRTKTAPMLFFGKLSHAVGGVILFAAGLSGVPFKKFFKYNFLATLPKSVILLAVGYFFGSTITNFRKAVNFTVLGLFIFTLVMIAVYFGINYFSNKFVQKMGK
jgi:membrane-associated protein